MRLKIQLLRDFTAALAELDPIHLTRIGAPDDEYEAEALSCLARFSECALHLSDDEGLALQVATKIVQETFEFWFDKTGQLSVDDQVKVASRLMMVYKTAYEQRREAVTQPDIKPVTEVIIGDEK